MWWQKLNNSPWIMSLNTDINCHQVANYSLKISYFIYNTQYFIEICFFWSYLGILPVLLSLRSQIIAEDEIQYKLTKTKSIDSITS